jgi:ABC-2 type transport system permease protein
MRQIAPRLPTDAPAFRAAPQPVLPAEGTLAPTDEGPAAFGDALATSLQGDVPTSEGKRPLALAVYIPKDFGTSGAPAHIWTNGRLNSVLIETVRTELTGALRSEALSRAGLAPAAFARIEAVSAPLTVTAPPPGRGRTQIAERSILPLAMVYLLLLTVIITGSMMLQGLIEERSNKLLESVLACIRPGELMYGKLLGLGAIGLTTVIVWAGCAVGAALAMHGAVADLLRPSLESFDHPWIAAALIFYFLAGYLVVSMIYLAIGSLSDSMQDANAYLVPVVMVIMLPIVFMMLAVVQNPNGILPQVLSWIPLYTPFAMLARLGSGVSAAEMLGTGGMLIAFIALEVVLLGRPFEVSLLRPGQPPKLGALVRLMLRPQAD